MSGSAPTSSLNPSMSANLEFEIDRPRGLWGGQARHILLLPQAQDLIIQTAVEEDPRGMWFTKWFLSVICYGKTDGGWR